ncbi:TlpA family protein disulfide reductase [Algoriphagus sp. PAP.12]|uniref:TlpA family protein disulfide reductase n=1 Tax=Algoriphagus sp. PAP.12 TaxID=2996678 RepID=UPI00227ADACA|nr:TlpA disulfide reductase family protein [Algoriphagus sp. PAP.12]
MKKLILLCFLGKVCPFLNRSSLTLSRLVSLSRQPFADIFHRQIRFISPAKGWHISIPNYQKWFLQACLILSILLGSINDVFGKVASPAGNSEKWESTSTFSDTLGIGDYLPFGEFDKVLQYESDRLQLEDYRGKYVVLEFWATWCSASSGSLYKVDELQEKFKSDIQFIPVTYESGQKVDAKLDAYPSMAALSLPLVVDERRLAKLFPHITLPHLVILDREGKIIAVTGKEDLTEENLELLVRTGSASFRLKEDKRIPFSLDENLISGNQQIPSKNIRFQSALTSYIPEVSGTLMDDRENGAHILAVNRTLLSLYRFAYSARDFANYIGMNRVILAGFGEEELDSPKTGLDYIAWREEGDHVFGYELIAPPGVDQYQIMQEDLDRYFPGIEAKLELRKRKVWALRLPEGKRYPASSFDQASYSFSPFEASIKNYPLIGLIYQLNQVSLQRSDYPLMDLTGIDYPIDLDMKGNFSKPEQLKAAFEKAGFILELSEEEILVLVLSKVSNTIYGER